MSITVIESQEQFLELIKKNKFVVADFYADWCGPCKAIAPLFQKLAAEHSLDDQLAFVKINVDDVPAVAQEYDVTAMPTFMFFANGAPAAVDATVPKGGAVVGDNGVNFIRGADPRALTAVAAKLGELAKANAAKVAAA